MKRRDRSTCGAVTWALPLLAAGLAVAGGCAGMPEDHWLTAVLKPLAPPSPGKLARDMFNRSDPDRRREAIALISSAPWGGQDDYLSAYRALVTDPDATVRAAAIKALGHHGRPEDVRVIVRYATDSSVTVRWEVAQALQRLHDPAAAVTPLMAQLNGDEDADVRQAAAAALGQYPERRVFDALVGALDDDDHGVVSACVRSLDTLTGYNFGPEGALWMIWARDSAQSLFAHRKPYLWQPFNKPPGFLDRIQFWQEPQEKPPRVPTGMEASAAQPAGGSRGG